MPVFSNDLEPVPFADVLDRWANGRPESQVELARMLGLSEQTFRRYRLNRQSPAVNRWQRIMRRPRLPRDFREAVRRWVDEQVLGTRAAPAGELAAAGR